MFVQHLLGFDARIAPHLTSVFWNTERADLFIIRKDVRFVLSVDTTPWPSVFDEEQSGWLAEDNEVLRRWAGLSKPEWIGMNRSLWEKLDLLYTQLQNAPNTSSKEYWIIAAAYEGEDTETEPKSGRTSFGPYLEPTEPRTIDPEWTFLGYDVADGSGISGLSNCGHDPEELTWAEHLNEFHLFDDREEAYKFAKFMDGQDTAHAPFFTYGLWRISVHEAE